MDILDLLAEIPDPRSSWKVKHPLSTLLFTTLCAVLSGVETWSDISDYCRAKKSWLIQYVDFPEGIPSPWTYRRIFTLIDPTQMEWLLRMTAAQLTNGKAQGIAIDGKALRGSRRHDVKCLHSVSAFCHEERLTLAELSVEKKSNEITAIPLLLDLLEIKGNTVTIDAAGCQKNIAEKITEKKGHYVLGLKKNHRKFYEKVASYCQENSIDPLHCLADYFDKSHGRLVRRRYFSCDATPIEGANQWSGLTSVIAVETISSQDNDPEVKAQWRYYLSSHDAKEKLLPEYIRGHWGIENSLHWVLDVHLKEDDDRKAERRSAKAFAILRRIVLNIVRTKDKASKKSLRRKIKVAGWDNDYLLRLLTE